MTSRLKTSATLHQPRAEKRLGIVPPRPMFPRYPPIRRLIAINDLRVALDTTYDAAVREALGYENERLDVDEAAAVLDWLFETAESNGREYCNDDETNGGGCPERERWEVGLRSLPGGDDQGHAAERELGHAPDLRAAHRLPAHEGRMLEMRSAQHRHPGTGIRQFTGSHPKFASQDLVVCDLVPTCPGRTGTEIARAIYGPHAPVSRVSEVCRRLVREGRVERQGSGRTGSAYRHWPSSPT